MLPTIVSCSATGGASRTCAGGEAKGFHHAVDEVAVAGTQVVARCARAMAQGICDQGGLAHPTWTGQQDDDAVNLEDADVQRGQSTHGERCPEGRVVQQHLGAQRAVSLAQQVSGALLGHGGCPAGRDPNAR